MTGFLTQRRVHTPGQHDADKVVDVEGENKGSTSPNKAHPLACRGVSPLQASKVQASQGCEGEQKETEVQQEGDTYHIELKGLGDNQATVDLATKPGCAGPALTLNRSQD